MKTNHPARWRIVLILIASASVPLASRAANNYWTNNAGGSWETTANWSAGALPGVTDQVRVGSNGTYTVTVGSSAANTVPNSFTNSDLLIHGYGGGSPTLLMNYTNALAFVVTNTVQIGNGTLTFDSPNGSLQIVNAFPRGLFMNDSSAGGPTPSGTQGVLNVQSGIFDTGGRAILASSVGTRSIVNVNTGGTFILRNNFRIANSGTAEINIRGGEATFGQGFIGYVAGATGRVILASGRMWVTNITSGTLGLGAGTFDSANHGYGELIISNGNFITGNNNLLAVGSGVAAAGGGGTGIMQVYGGDHTNNARIFVASSINSTGLVLLAGGRWAAGTSWFVGSGSNSFGSLTISNASYVGQGNGGGVLSVGDGNYAVGEVNLAGGEILLTNSIGATAEAYVSIGSASNSVARLRVSDGRMAVLNSGGGLFIGTGNNAFGATTTNTDGVAAAVLTGGRMEVRRLVVAGTGVLSNKVGGLLQFSGADIVSGSPSSLVVDGGTLSYKSYSALNVTGSVAKFSIVNGSGLQLDSSTNVNLAGTYALADAPGSFKELSLTGAGPLWRSDSLSIGSGTRLHVSNAIGARISSVITNSGTILVQNSTVTYQNPVTIGGLYISDPSTNTFTSNVTVNASGALVGGSGDLFDFKKNLFIHSTNKTVFDLDSSVVKFSGGGNHTNEVTGGDFGTNGYPVANFMYGRLSLGSSTDQLYFASGGFSNGSASNALYVRELDLLGNINLVTNLHSSFNIYYLLKEHATFNTYLNDQTYSLSGGGLLMPFIPEPSSVMLLMTAACAFLLRRHSSSR